MRIAVLTVLLALAAVPAQAQTTTRLDDLAELALKRAYPDTPETAPDIIEIDPALAAALRAEPIDGGREKTLYLKLEQTGLVLARSIAGERYRATGRCTDCDFETPIDGHTHPYENPLSVQDLVLTVDRRKPSLMAARDGRLWLAVPTQASLDLPDGASTGWTPLRHGFFSNRLECPARAPSDGWASDTAMARRVETAARAAAHQLHIALYVAEPGGLFRKLAPMPASDELLRWDRAFTPAELNAHERTLLRLLHVANGWRIKNGVVWPAPDQPMPELQALLDAAPEEEEAEVPEVVDGARKVANRASLASARWFSALPTTVYAQPFSDPTVPELSFASVQTSADCRDILLLEGVQTFAPDTVRYTRGWRRPRDLAGPETEGWTPIDPADFPTGQVVPW